MLNQIVTMLNQILSMLNQVLTIAERELIDGWRDRRSVMAAALYCLMGPGVVTMVSVSLGKSQGVHAEGSQEVLVDMMSVFTLVSAFVGGMNVAMDSIAGERERRSLVPLLMHPITRLELLLGKWLAVAAFSIAGLTLNLVGYVPLLHRAPPLALALCLIPLSLAAAALEVWISVLCRGVKEAHTYLSMLVFVPMGLGMFIVFSPVAGRGWWKFVPVAGQQLQLEGGMRGAPFLEVMHRGDPLAILVLGFSTAILAGVALAAAAHRLEQDDVVYGG
jgi:sodium transport system permease protein